MKNLTAILLDEADVKDANAVMSSLSEDANDAAMTAAIVVFRGQIVKNRFGAADVPGVAAVAAVVAIGAAFGGGVYAGVIRGVDGAPDQHLVLLDGRAEDVSWDDAVVWAESVGGSLPTRAEQRLLMANLPEQFEPRWYWSGEPAGSSYAWGQSFVSGGQLSGTRSYEGRARAVRRLPI